MFDIRKRAVAGLKKGDVFVVSRTFYEEDTHAFAGMTRDFNPIHFEDRFVRAKGMKGKICHGLLVGSLLTEIGGQIGWLASEIRFRFRKPVFFGDAVECRLTILELDEKNHALAEAVFRNQKEEVVLEASLSGYIPGLKEKRVMKSMIDEGDPTNKIN
ncbi:MAG: MaoC family dehydratase [Candidatus Aminicenantes bacterium]|nr:MaoC family dehydratase [Candidatus Aminicenantes bacterium]